MDDLDPAGAALIPLFIPDPVPERQLGHVREHVDDSGRTLRVTATSSDRDEAGRLQTRPPGGRATLGAPLAHSARLP